MNPTWLHTLIHTCARKVICTYELCIKSTYDGGYTSAEVSFVNHTRLHTLIHTCARTFMYTYAHREYTSAILCESRLAFTSSLMLRMDETSGVCVQKCVCVQKYVCAEMCVCIYINVHTCPRWHSIHANIIYVCVYMMCIHLHLRFWPFTPSWQSISP